MGAHKYLLTPFLSVNSPPLLPLGGNFCKQRTPDPQSFTLTHINTVDFKERGAHWLNYKWKLWHLQWFINQASCFSIFAVTPEHGMPIQNTHNLQGIKTKFSLDIHWNLPVPVFVQSPINPCVGWLIKVLIITIDYKKQTGFYQESNHRPLAKHRHRRNVTSHHSFSLLWQF